MPVIALLTDFGTRDHYVGAMKGVLVSVCPDATLVDITHEIEPQDVLGAALALEAAHTYFPPGSVFLVIVDPGVGTSRRPLAADAGGYRFVGPDNGVLSRVVHGQRHEPARIVELKEKKFARATVSKTFEGRDRFAPAAGWLARGTALEALGPAVVDPVLLEVPVAKVTPAAIEGEVLRVDRFGSLITNIDERLLSTLRSPRVTIAGRDVGPIVSTYADADPGALCALLGSTGHLEIAVNRGDAAQALAARRGVAVKVTEAR